MDRQTILMMLPEYRDEWELINPNQYVPDIIEEIVTAHRLYRPYYDQLCGLFYTSNVKELCERLYTFCKKNIRYKEESVEFQTSALPTGILKRGYGDCKHYALFNAGVIDALNRMYGMDIQWSYVFTGYNGAKEPYHVFVCVYYQGQELWIDPTPGYGGEPSVLIERFV
jgi:hypothetical protein